MTMMKEAAFERYFAAILHNADAYRQLLDPEYTQTALATLYVASGWGPRRLAAKTSDAVWMVRQMLRDGRRLVLRGQVEPLEWGWELSPCLRGGSLEAARKIAAEEG